MNPILYIRPEELTLYKDLHRSGWNYVVSSLYNTDYVAKPTETYDPVSDSSLLFLDTYLDRTFHWDYNYLKAKGQVPYTKKWIGFLHHTFDETYSVYNSTSLFKNADFISSLPHCQGIYVLSYYMKNLTANALYDISQEFGDNIPVYALIHPTQLVSEDKLWTRQAFLDNEDKKLIQIGAWMRDMYAIYRLPDMTQYFGLNKAILVGPKMENYVIPSNFFNIFEQQEDTSPTEPFESDEIDTDQLFDPSDPTAPQYYTQGTICRDVNTQDFAGNRFVKGVHEYLKRAVNAVEVVSQLNDDDYDSLLTQNIVYVQLYDSSAINTLVECIVRNTPIIVNPLPSIVEMLGPRYPWYYDQNTDSPAKFASLFTPRTFPSITGILSNYNKDQFTFDYFLDTFVNTDPIQNILSLQQI
jgi:hypothetical protein